MTMEYQKWKYIYCKNSKELYSVVPNQKIQIPETLFKYYALSENSIDALTGFYVYATHPNQLNDPTDCYDGIMDFSKTGEEDLHALYDFGYNNMLDIYGKEGLAEASPDYYKILAYSHLGIISLCDNCKNPVMWANYAQNNGFCIEFDYSQFHFQCYGPFPIHYVDNIETINIDRNIAVATLVQTNVKLKQWEYENEFRILVSNPIGTSFELYDNNGILDRTYNIGGEHNRKFRYPLSAIKSVILPIRFLKDKDTRFYQVWSNEYEIVLINSTLKEKVLNLLSNQNFAPQIKLARIGNNGHFSLFEIRIFHNQDKTYRVILNTNNHEE